MYLIPGIVGFAALCLFDINKIRWQSKKLNLFFVLGNLLILFSTICGIFKSDLSHLAWPYLILLVLAGSGFIYTLFFALPFGETYMGSDTIPVMDHGVYGLCRHPSFWMLTLAYLFLWLFIRSSALRNTFIIYTICNFIYVLIQDRYIFPLYIRGYDEYKKSVPFLIPRLFRR